MVAFLSAQEKLYDPWKELIDYYQVYQDARVRYYRTMEQFAVVSDFDPEQVAAKEHTLNGRVEVKDLLFETGELLPDFVLGQGVAPAWSDGVPACGGEFHREKRL